LWACATNPKLKDGKVRNYKRIIAYKKREFWSFGKIFDKKAKWQEEVGWFKRGGSFNKFNI